MTNTEKELLIQVMVNVDEIVAQLTLEQLVEVKPSVDKVYESYYKLLRGA